MEKVKDEEHHVIWHSNHNSKHKNGFTGDKIHVKIYSQADARDSIAQETRKLIKSAKCSDIKINFLDKCFQSSYEFPDPDMGIYCGKSFFLYEYPPWQMRITEFFNIRTHHSINFRKFVDLMYKYNKCERRLGK